MESLEPKLQQTLTLPKLPVPELKHTLMRYQMTMQPLLEPEVMKELEDIAEKFAAPGGEGEVLQKGLLRKQEQDHNWAFQYWLHSMYLRVPLALPVNSNPGMVFPRRQFSTNDAMLLYMAQLIHGAYQWRVKLNSVGLPIDRCSSRDKGQPLCMEQYHRVMTTYRRPGRSRDYQLDTSSAQAQYIMVCCGGQQFQLSLTEDWEPLTVDELAFQLRRCQQMAEQSPDSCQVALLTSDDRRVWGESREALING
ncbi:choline O-acetyltransferase-like [Pollicipes pollicipes]|uniref:choline O-acetyltransferase-like n=1 Tax=Pollicipes pollicipes TaxID=41117 RepID=UPI001885860E|nr:choline O-acetyltransferase-like [Pollicipes pollicipes]